MTVIAHPDFRPTVHVWEGADGWNVEARTPRRRLVHKVFFKEHLAVAFAEHLSDQHGWPAVEAAHG